MTALDPSNIAALLPVGMLANTEVTNPAAQALDTLARRKAGQTQWEPFHYEKITADEYEVNGAVPLLVGGVKRFPEPHYSVVVSLEEIIAELQKQGKLKAAASPAQPVPAMTVATDSADCMTIVLQLPADVAGRKRILDAFKTGSEFFGATVCATVPGNAIASNRAQA
jgi:hypothetical protein